MNKILLVLISLFLITNPLYAGGNRWTSKPPIGAQVDWSHPLAKGLVGCFLMNEGGGRIVNDLSNRGITGNNVSATWSLGKRGSELKFVATSSQYVEFTKNISKLDALTNGSVIIYATPASLHIGTIFSLANSLGAFYWGLFVRVSAGGFVEVLVRKDDVTWGIIQDTDNVVYSANKPIQIVITQDSVLYKCYVNAVQQAMSNAYASTSTALGAWFNYPTGINNRLRFGYASDSTPDNPFNGKIEYIYNYNRALSPQEIQQLYIDPYCFIKPPTIWSNFKTAVAAGVIKTLNGLGWSSVKTYKGLAVGSIKTINGAASQ